MKSILSKRGEGVEPLMVLALGITVLAVLGFAFYLHYSGKIEFFKFLPDFNTTVEKEETVEILRYDINTTVDFEDSVQYYDGTKWNGFPSASFKLGKHNLVYDDVKGDFTTRYWFNKELREMSDTYVFSDDVYDGDNPSKEIYEVRVEAQLISFASDGMTIRQRDIVSKIPYANYYFGNEGVLKWVRVGESEIPEVVPEDHKKGQELKSYFLEWRDSILQGEKDAKMASIGGVNVCVKKYDDRYLVVDLDKEVNSDEGCK